MSETYTLDLFPSTKVTLKSNYPNFLKNILVNKENFLDLLDSQYHDFSSNLPLKHPIQLIPIQYANRSRITELEALIGDLKKEIQSLRALNKHILDVKDVATLTGYKVGYIYQLVHKKEIPYFQSASGRSKPLFKRQEIEEWLTAYKVKSIYCIEDEVSSYTNEL